MTFFVSQGGRRQDLQPVSGNAFLLPKLSADSLALGLEYAGRTISLLKLRASWLTHGGEVAFGTIDHFGKRQRQDEKAQLDDYYSPLTEIGIPFYNLIRDENISKLVKQTGRCSLIYQTYQPRVWGDPVVLTSYTVE
ncbi:hypothetical protein [Solirubrum puertoriconensis]|nr:hypothetical protein [Solirubrum puertoriconensis]